MMFDRELTLAVVGLGYWGPNLVRASIEIEDAQVHTLCDTLPERLAQMARRYPMAKVTTDYDVVLADPEIDAVLLATPIARHHPMALAALRAGKHVFVEKPLATTAAECEELIEEAAAQDLVLMPGHTFLYSPPVVKIKSMLDAGELGELFFLTSTRVNLGIHQSDSSVIRDLAPHDFSILHYWLGPPLFVRAIARDSIVPGTMDVAFIDLGYDSGTLVRIELSWLAPAKLRRTVLAGRRKMVVYDDTSAEPVRVFDRGVDIIEPQSYGEHQLAYRVGDVLSPRVDVHEPLRVELTDFVDCIRQGTEPRSSGRTGLDVVRMVEAAETSLHYNGAPVSLDTTPDDRRRSPDRRRGYAGMPLLRGADPRLLLGPER
jgi:predicted dehydrogenase